MDNLEQIVRENRFTISIIFPLVGAIGFLASAEAIIPEVFRFSPLMILFGTLVMRLPLIAGLKPLIDRELVFGLGVLTFYTYFIEYIGLQTGWPYGEFEYAVSLGPMIQGVPVGLPLFFIPLVLNSYFLTTLIGFEGLKRLFTSLVFVLMVDFVLDPAAVSLGLWNYPSGIFYGVPLSNFLGWVLSGTIALVILELSFNSGKLFNRLSETEFMLDDMVSFVFLWGIVNLYYLNTVPVLIAAGFGVMLHRLERFEFAF